MDAERRRLSLSLKRVDGDVEGEAPALGLSEEVFSDQAEEAPELEAGAAAAADPEGATEPQAAAEPDELEASAEPEADEAAAVPEAEPDEQSRDES